MNQDRDSKFDPRIFSAPNLFSSHLSKIVEQTKLSNHCSASEISKLVNQHNKMTVLPEIPKLSEGLLQSIKSTKDLLANSGLSKVLLETQGMPEFTGIAKMSQALMESQNNIKGIFADSGLTGELVKSLSTTKGLFNELKLTELFRGEELKLLTGYKNGIDTLYGFTKTLKIEGLAQSSLSKFALEDVGKLISLQDNYRNQLLEKFDSLSSSYSHLAKLRNTELINAFPANLLLEYPALEILESTNLIEVITEEDSDRELESEKISSRDDVLQDLEGLEKFLVDIGATELIVMWKGALDAIEQEHSDYARHCSVSLRELLTQVLHRLAPEEEIKKWTDDPQMFDRNRPTRRSRLLYICRSVNEDIFTDFIEKDISSVLEFFKLFQRGTHQVQIPYTKRQLKAMKSKVESTLCYLIEVWKLNKE